jgi:tetratricopeptide (TPR) repeat protein
VNKDSLISAVFGLLLGFIAGYLLHEVMASRQPPRLVAGAQNTMPGAQSMPGAGAPPGAPAPDQGAAQAMQQEMQSLEQYIQENPNDAEALRRLADLSFEQARWPQARELYTRFLEMQPGNPDVLSDLGVVYRGLGEPDKALAHFDEAQRQAPQHWQSRYNEVIVLLDLKRFDEAQQVMGELKMLQPGNPNVAQLDQELQKQRNAA